MTNEAVILDDQLWQGSYVGRADLERLADEGVTHVLNLDLPYDRMLIELADLDTISVAELRLTPRCEIRPEDARRALAVITRSLAEGGRLYLHCSATGSHARAIGWLYLVCCRGFTRREANALICGADQGLDVEAFDKLAGIDACLRAIDCDALRAWVNQPRWELWRHHPSREGRELLSVHDAGEPAQRELERHLRRYRPNPAQPAASWHWIEAIRKPQEALMCA